MRKTLKEWLETNYNKHLADKRQNTINVFDVEYMQGVSIFCTKPLDVILNDKPVVKFLDYYVVSVELDADLSEPTVNIGVSKE